MNLPAQLTITDHTQKSWSFNTLEAFDMFIKNQANFWSQKQVIASQNPTANQYIQRANNFHAIINTIESWKPQLEDWDVNTFNSNFTNLINSNIGTSWLWSGHPFLEKWIELNQVSVVVADAFFEALVQKTTSRFAQGMDYFQGYLIAYEYANSDKTDISKRRSSETKSLSNLRDQLVDKNDEIIGKVDKFQQDVISWKSKTESDFSKWFGKQQSHLDSSVLYQSKGFHEQLSSWTNKVTELENLYRENLRFEGAARYWFIKAGEFRKQGYCWIAVLVFFLLLGVGLFSKYFLAWLGGQPSGLGLQSIEGILIFAAVLSTYAFLIKVLSKLTFSAFHLQRDAEEREQLTHLYLNLREGKDDDAESRRIVLQALFSRSDSGLLAGEHSPTMPTIQDTIKIIKP